MLEYGGAVELPIIYVVENKWAMGWLMSNSQPEIYKKPVCLAWRCGSRQHGCVGGTGSSSEAVARARAGEGQL